MRSVLVDAGPLVALLDRGDSKHAECVAALKTPRGSLVTVWPAFTEALSLLPRVVGRAESAVEPA